MFPLSENSTEISLSENPALLSFPTMASAWASVINETYYRMVHKSLFFLLQMGFSERVSTPVFFSFNFAVARFLLPNCIALSMRFVIQGVYECGLLSDSLPD